MTKSIDVNNFGAVATEKLTNGLREIYHQFGDTTITYLVNIARPALFSGNPKGKSARNFQEAFGRFHNRHKLPKQTVDAVLALMKRLVDETRFLIDLRRHGNRIPVPMLTALDLRIQDVAGQVEKVVADIARVADSEIADAAEQKVQLNLLASLRALRTSLSFDLDVLNAIKAGFPVQIPLGEDEAKPKQEVVPGVKLVNPQDPHGESKPLYEPNSVMEEEINGEKVVFRVVQEPTVTVTPIEAEPSKGFEIETVTDLSAGGLESTETIVAVSPIE